MDKEFNAFWNIYAKKRGKQATLKQWDKLDALDRQMVLDNVSAFVRNNPNPVYRPDPERYLKHRRFEDENPSQTPQEPTSASYDRFTGHQQSASIDFDTWADEMEDRFGVRPEYPSDDQLSSGINLGAFKK
jgi:hypothetical protein